MEGFTMNKINRLPREQVTGQPDDVVNRNVDDGLNVDADVEGHHTPAPLTPGMPGTGGDFRRPSGGGEIDGDDVEGHRAGPGFSPQAPGTGGDFRRPSGGGEIDGDDVEGHTR
jgi:hypothetical protein